MLSKPRAKLSEKQRRRYQELQQQAMPAHGGEPFIAEADLRALPSFKKGEVRGRLSRNATGRCVEADVHTTFAEPKTSLS